MYVQVTIEIETAQYDVRIDSAQPIGAALEALQSARKCAVSQPVFRYKSGVAQRIVSSFCSFENERIYSGEILTAIL